MHPNLHHGAAAPGSAAPELAHHPVVNLAPLGTTGAALAGLSPPHKDEAPRLAGAEGFRDQDKADTTIVADLDGPRKAFLTLRARLALAGWVLTATPNSPHGAFSVSRWGMLRDLATLAAVAAFADRVGAP